MRVLCLITGLGIGGAETQVFALCERMAALGHDVLLVSLTDAAPGFASGNGFSVHLLGMNKSVGSAAAAYFRLRHLTREFAADVVHSHMFHANLFARLLRLSTRLPRLICSAHSTNEGGVVRMLAYRLTDRLSDLNTNVSAAAVEAFVRHKASPGGRIVAMHNGIDCTRFAFSADARHTIRATLDVAPKQRLLLAVGRLAPAKDYPNLLHAFAAVCGRRDDVRLVIVGEGKEREALQSLARELAIEPRLTLLGLRRDIPQLMSGADVFVLSSAWEGFGLVVGEAMACERVVVATDCGGVAEIVGASALLVPARDSQALAAALDRALDLGEREAQAAGVAARHRIEQMFSLDRVVSDWLRHYQTLRQPDRNGT